VVFTNLFWVTLAATSAALSASLFFVLRRENAAAGATELMLQASSFVALSLFCREVGGISSK
jgi:hypothetical protein